MIGAPQKSNGVAIAGLVVALVALGLGVIALVYSMDMSGPSNKDLGKNPCTQGPSFWCANDNNFARCIQSKGYDGVREDFDACKALKPPASSGGARGQFHRQQFAEMTDMMPLQPEFIHVA